MVRVGLWGRYDLEDVGATLFPSIARVELLRRLPGSTLNLWAPDPGRTPNRFAGPGLGLPDPLGAWSEARLDELATAIDVLVIDGATLGERAEDGGDARRFLVGGVGPANEGVVPTAWHAAHVTQEPSGAVADEIREVLGRRAYVSVRDGRSRERLLGLGVEREVVVVPDPAVLVDRVFRRDRLEDWTIHLRKAAGLPDGDFLAVQGGDVLLDHADQVAEQVARLCRERSLAPVVVETGAADGAFASALVERLREARRLPATGLEGLCAVLAWSAGFVGSSPQAFLASAAFDRPGVLLDPSGEGLDPAQLLDPDRLVEDPASIAEAFERAIERGPVTDRVEEIRARLDAHLERLAGLPSADAERPRSVTAGAAGIAGREDAAGGPVEPSVATADPRGLLARLAAREAASAERERELQELIDSLTRQITEVDVRFTKLWRKIRECDKHYEWQFNRAERAEARLGNVDAEIAAIHEILRDRDATIAEMGRHLMPWYRVRRRLRRWRRERAAAAAEAGSAEPGS